MRCHQRCFKRLPSVGGEEEQRLVRVCACVWVWFDQSRIRVMWCRFRDSYQAMAYAIYLQMSQLIRYAWIVVTSTCNASNTKHVRRVTICLTIVVRITTMPRDTSQRSAPSSVVVLRTQVTGELTKVYTTAIPLMHRKDIELSVHLPFCCCCCWFSNLNKIDYVNVKDVFEALWRTINSFTKSSLTFLLGLLLKAIGQGRIDARDYTLEIIQFELDLAHRRPPISV